MKKLFLKIASWFQSKPQHSTQDEINFDLERFQIKFCKKCGHPFEPLAENQNYCSKACRIRFNNNKRRK